MRKPTHDEGVGGESLSDHPGYLGFTSRGVIAINADWPAYPAEHGVHVALASLGRFPVGTAFLPIDDIDRCVLLARLPITTADPYDSAGYHVAVWHEDLLALSASGWVSGVGGTTERRWEKARREQFREHLGALGADDADPLDHVFVQLPSGDMSRVSLPDIDEFDNEWDGYPSFTDVVSITGAGWEYLHSILSESLIIPQDLARRLQPLIESGLFDSAVRDVGIALETRLRTLTGSTEFGARLAETFVKDLAAQDQYIGAYVKLVRTELRTAFKFIRNEYAHNLVDLPATRGLALLSRMCWVYELIRGPEET